MPGGFTAVRIHLVWCTQGRRPWLDPEWRPRLFAHASALAERRNARLLCAGGTRDHVHLYLEHPPEIALSHLVNALKTGTAQWIQSTYSHRKEFGWQTAYGAFSVTPRDDGAVQNYIREQETHHRTRPFYAEYVSLLEQHGVSYDLHRLLD